MICAFDIIGQPCWIMFDDDKKYCKHCKSRCSTFKDLEERKNLHTNTINEARNVEATFKVFEANLREKRKIR